MSVTEFAMVEELAFLVRDNLRSKHLVLAMEETFVNFLQSDTSSDDVLELEPMDPYNRLLLHRLADIFGFAHVSIGEGESRHLVLERFPETSIPAILVSDILFQCDEAQYISVPDQVLRRDDATPVLQSKTPSLSTIKEREAAYLAARQRIFSTDAVDELREPVEHRPRNVPAVARRMIAHALGQKRTPPGKDRDWDEENKVEEEECKSTSLEASQGNSSSVAEGFRRKSSSQNEMNRNRVKEFSKEEHSRAARRMFAHALGLQPTKGSSPATR